MSELKILKCVALLCAVLVSSIPKPTMMPDVQYVFQWYDRFLELLER